MLPREHGAYFQMALPLVTSLVVARASLPAVFIAIAVICGFLAHEPLLLLLGGRGVRARQATGSRARAWFATTIISMLAAGVAAFWLTSATARWSFVLPLVPAAWVGAAVLSSQEKHVSTEIAVALAFALTAFPICLSAGVEIEVAASVALVFASVSVTGVLCVRAIVLGMRGGGNPRASRATRIALIKVAVGSALGMVIAVTRAWLPWMTLAAATPGLATAVALAMGPRRAQLKTVGWSLALMSAAAALILISAARSGAIDSDRPSQAPGTLPEAAV
jgi:YwiC-like protein